MKYFEYTFTLTPSCETNTDVLSALLADIGFETFLPTEEGMLKAYVQQSLLTPGAVDELISNFPLPDVKIRYNVCTPDDKDWNETWEQEGFEPIQIDTRLVICDTHHEVDKTSARCILIHPRQAFGTGSHQTTRMILTQLLELASMSPSQIADKRIVDAGCGTGILGFLCLLEGAGKVLSYDIDEWSVQNTLDNVILNPNINATKLEVRLGNADVLKNEKDYNLLIANINRNILLADLPTFAATLSQQDARLLISGFYTEDAPMLIEAAAQYGFSVEHQANDGEWAMLLLKR